MGHLLRAHTHTHTHSAKLVVRITVVLWPSENTLRETCKKNDDYKIPRCDVDLSRN